jgi:hypothetical protein
MLKQPEPNFGKVPPLDSWRLQLKPQALADRLHSAAVIALKIAAGAGYRIDPPSQTQPRFEIAQCPSEDWALPRPVQEAVQLLELANELVPLLAADSPHPQLSLIESAFSAGELTARMPAWAGVTTRGPKG